MFQFPASRPGTLCIHVTVTGYCPVGFPHSDISGSTLVCNSPKLFAAYHVLHRLFVPRHPPYALSNLTIFYLCTMQHYPSITIMLMLQTKFSKNRAPYWRLTDTLEIVSRVILSATIQFLFSLDYCGKDSYGADRVRTDDLRLAKPSFSQLNYSPGHLLLRAWA